MLWIYLAVVAYFFTAITFIIDKYLLALPIPKPFAYAFWVGMLSSPVVLLIPFFSIRLPSLLYFIIAIISGSTFFVGLIFLYKAIQKSDISVASTQVYTITPIFTYIFALIILNESIPKGATLGLFFLIPGILLLGKLGKGIFMYSLTAGVLFGLSFTLLKWTFIQSDIVNGIFWTRLGLVGAALLTLLIASSRKEVLSTFKKSASSSKLILIGNKILGGVGFVLIYIAINLGSVTVVNALLGFQFLFIFLIALVLRNKIPGIKENLRKNTIIQKLLGIILVIMGFFVIIF